MEIHAQGRLALLIAIGAIFAGGAITAAAAEPIADRAAAIRAAQKYMKARCTERTPCRFRSERDGHQWRVWVRLSERNSRGQAVYPSPGKQIVLSFDASGNLIRRLEVE
jgi:hypothetical protein